jgi:hypothetical protein
MAQTSPNLAEHFGNRARNTGETNAMYLTSTGSGQNTQWRSLVRPQIATETTQLENVARPFASNFDKYPRIAKQPVQNIYLLLDSKNRELSTDDSVFKWTVLHSANVVQGSVNTLSDQIHNIINIQFDQMYIPYVSSADNVYRKITLFVEEISSMSVLMNNNRRYHMMFNTDVQGNRIEMTPLVNDEGRFRFHTPINILDSITIKMFSPFTPITFLPDRYAVTLSTLNATQSIITFSQEHKVADGELVHIEEYDTLASTTDSAAISVVNKEEGHIVTYIDNLTLRIDINLSTVTHDPNNIAKCFIASRRLIIPVRMEYIVH